ncbi:FAD-binding and (Fe-S)-binding domain-containing protein [Actinomyces minihominis]|uniref:FAD-binding and (Fe-S)-binding domain-containing protein n=1 Tax=Actinomyces minihominis TaxID=2002838 RepID=UPI001A92A7E9|nr:FAD-binding and (Fe-S)-binding domain-containing protein [Actinomyces minihominis]
MSQTTMTRTQVLKAEAAPEQGITPGLTGRAAAAVEELYRRTMAHDASHFLKYPDRVCQVGSAAEMAELFQEVTAEGSHITFRAGGTSLNGQGQTDSVLVDTRTSFKATVPLDGGERIWSQPGVTIRHLNTVLKRHRRQMGPDPASEIAATVGGVLANNASGMSCGTEYNSYRMLDSLEFVLPSGTIINTADPQADQVFAKAEPHLYITLTKLRHFLRGRSDLVQEIRRQFSMKNTMGYGLNSFLDFEQPVQIFAHLLIGSEGTLGFISEAIFKTLPVREKIATGLWVFPDVERACAAIPQLVATGASALELMDSRSLTVAQSFTGVPEVVSAIDVVDHAALLIEYQADDEDELREQIAKAEEIAAELNLESSFTSDPVIRAGMWTVRKGLYTTVAGAREPGVTALLEDIAVPVDNLAATVSTLSKLLAQFGYNDAVIFGHAKDGNLHFMLTDNFDEAEGRQRLRDFTEAMVDMVLEAGGTLKAEHGTGRAMSPFVERQYGAELYGVMVEIKRAADPSNILNPGVIITDDPEIHLRDVKTTPGVDPLVDRCVECGYCEPSCPSQRLTLTPRTRIVAEREIAMATMRGNHEMADLLDSAFQYAGVDTCAVDGMCLTACPLGINTGDLVRQERKERAPLAARGVWTLAAQQWSLVTQGAALALNVAKVLPAGLVEGTTRVMRSVLGENQMPLWTPDLPGGGTSRKKVALDYLRGGSGATVPEAVYLPSCLNTMFAPAPLPGGEGAANTQADFQELCRKAGVRLLIPSDIDSLCCGTPWSSKGIADGYEIMRERVIASMRRSTGGGRVPIVCDNSSCTEGLVKMLRDAGLTVIDSPVFLRDVILPRLEGEVGKRPWDNIILHPTCSTTHLGSTAAVEEVAGVLGEEVRIPDNWGCCAFAGDRGMLLPELTESATGPESAEVVEHSHGDTTLHVSSNRTCEIGMTRATGEEYVSLISAVARTVR